MSEQISTQETAAPAAGQTQVPGGSQSAQTTPGHGQQAPAQAQPPAFTMEDILRAAQPQRSPEEQLALLNEQYRASSSEAKRLAAWSKAARAALAEQGLDVLDTKDGGFAGFKANDKFSKDLGSLDLSDVSFTAKEKELLAEDPEKALRAVVARVGERVAKAYTRAAPTIDKVVEPVAPERIAASHRYLAVVKDLDGAVKYPEYEKDAPVVDQLIQQLPEAVRNGFAGNETLLAELMHARLQHIRAGLSSLAQRKQAAEAAKQAQAKESASVQVQGHGAAVIKTGSPEGKSLAAQLLGVTG